MEDVHSYHRIKRPRRKWKPYGIALYRESGFVTALGDQPRQHWSCQVKRSHRSYALRQWQCDSACTSSNFKHAAVCVQVSGMAE